MITPLLLWRNPPHLPLHDWQRKELRWPRVSFQYKVCQKQNKLLGTHLPSPEQWFHILLIKPSTSQETIQGIDLHFSNAQNKIVSFEEVEKVKQTKIYLIYNFLVAQILWFLRNCHKELWDIHNLKMSWKSSNGWHECEGQWFGSRFLRRDLQNTKLVQLLHADKNYFYQR